MRSWKFIALVAAGFVSAGVAIGAVVAAHQSTRPAVLPSGPPAGSYRGSKPPPGIRAPDFRLRSYRGGEVQMRDLKGKVVVVTFLDTACRDKCPIIASLMGAGMHRLTPGERAQVEAL